MKVYNFWFYWWLHWVLLLFCCFVCGLCLCPCWGKWLVLQELSRPSLQEADWQWVLGILDHISPQSVTGVHCNFFTDKCLFFAMASWSKCVWVCVFTCVSVYVLSGLGEWPGWAGFILSASPTVCQPNRFPSNPPLCKWQSAVRHLNFHHLFSVCCLQHSHEKLQPASSVLSQCGPNFRSSVQNLFS